MLAKIQETASFIRERMHTNPETAIILGTGLGSLVNVITDNMLMKKYNVSADRVIRHFDVNGKPCPAYWVDSAKWEAEFWGKLGGVTAPTEKETAKPAFPYLVKINTDTLNVRVGAGTGYKIKTTVKRGEVYTITAESNGWGKLKSGTGWIKLSYTIKM